MALMFKIFSSENEGSGATIIFSDGTVQQIPSENPKYAEVVRILTTTPVDKINEEELLALVVPALTVGKSLTRLSERVSFDGNNILFDGDVVSDAIAEHILRIVKEGGNADSYKALVAFMEKLYTNPSESSRNALYNFIVRHNITIDPDGDFYAYKGVKADGGSILEGFGIVDGVSMTGSLPNKPGSILEIPRATVLANNKIGCGVGLHAGTYEYAKGWSRGLLLLVKINPRDVVSVPDDYSYQKIRTCRYKVISQTIHKNTATTATASVKNVVEDSFDALLRMTGNGEEVPVTFNYTRGNGETIKVSLTVTELRTTNDTVIIVGKDANGEVRNYRNTYIADLVITKPIATAPKARTTSNISPDVVELLTKIAYTNVDVVYCDFNYVTLNGETRTVKNFEATGTRIGGWSGAELLIGEREDGETRSYRADRITDLVVHDDDDVQALAVAVPTLTQAQLDNATPLDEAILRSSIAIGEKVTVSFDYTKVDGEARSVKNFVVEEIKSYNKELLVGIREDGETRTYRMDRIKNLVVQDEAAQVDDSKVDIASIQAAIVTRAPRNRDLDTIMQISADKVKDIVGNGEIVILDFDYVTVAGESRSVENFEAHEIKGSLLIGEREDGEIRSYRLDRIKKAIYRGVK